MVLDVGPAMHPYLVEAGRNLFNLATARVRSRPRGRGGEVGGGQPQGGAAARGRRGAGRAAGCAAAPAAPGRPSSLAVKPCSTPRIDPPPPPAPPAAEQAHHGDGGHLLRHHWWGGCGSCGAAAGQPWDCCGAPAGRERRAPGAPPRAARPPPAPLAAPPLAPPPTPTPTRPRPRPPPLPSPDTDNELNREFEAQGDPGQYASIVVAAELACVRLDTLAALAAPPRGEGPSDWVNALLVGFRLRFRVGVVSLGFSAAAPAAEASRQRAAAVDASPRPHAQRTTRQRPPPPPQLTIDMLKRAEQKFNLEKWPRRVFLISSFTQVGRGIGGRLRGTWTGPAAAEAPARRAAGPAAGPSRTAGTTGHRARTAEGANPARSSLHGSPGVRRGRRDTGGHHAGPAGVAAGAGRHRRRRGAARQR
jgi:hypothetical protein